MRKVEGTIQIKAILVSDLHLQAKPPVARSGEPDWFEAMAKPLNEIRSIQSSAGGPGCCPILYAGDIFDRWNSPPEVIGFALEHLPPGYAVPGQHDLPNHSYGEMHRSAYGVLVAAGHIQNAPPAQTIYIEGGVSLTGFPWGFEPSPLNPDAVSESHPLAVALIHRYVWIKGCSYPGADENHYLIRDYLKGYSVAAYGDNHIGFVVKPDKKMFPWVINCGGFMRRTTAEIDYRPGIGLLMSDGSVMRHYLNTDGEVMSKNTDAEEAVAQALDMSAFVDDLKSLGSGDSLDFEAAMLKFLDKNKARLGVRQVICNALDAGF